MQKKKPERGLFSRQLADARHRAGLSQQALGNLMGLSQRAIANWETRANASPHPRQLAQLVDILGISFEELLIGDKPKKSGPRGPKGKLLLCFEEATKLTPHYQKELVKLIEMFLDSKKK